jgi:hypothetical protein
MSKDLIAPCGIDCVNCEVYIENGRTEIWERFAAALKTTPDKIACPGCRKNNGCSVHQNCETLACVKEKGVGYCFECDMFPCDRLLPLAERADKVPHNLKVFNLCRIKLVGEKAFLDECALRRKKYFEGKFKIGAGPQL